VRELIEGAALVLGDDVNTDILQPSRYFSLEARRRVAGVLAGQRERGTLAGIVILAGRNFGVGSSRESVARGMIEAGVAAIAAASVSRIFLRNAVNRGLPIAAGLDRAACATIATGDRVALDLRAQREICTSRSVSAAVDPLDPYLAAVLHAGGLLPYLESVCDTSTSP